MDGKSQLSFTTRFGIAWQCFWRALGQPDFARRVAAELNGTSSSGPEARVVTSPPKAPEPVPEPRILTPSPTKVPVLPPEQVHASGLLVLSLLQRDGRLIDFLQENVTAFSDAEVGAAARVVHAGCKKALAEHFTVAPVLHEAEGESVSLPAGFDAGRIRITGNVAGQPPFRGALKHHGWVASEVRLPAVAESLDPRVLAPAEVEL